MAVTITYNGQTLAPVLGKIKYSETVEKAVLQVDFYTPASGLSALIDALNDWDDALSITSGSFVRTYSVAANTAVAIRTTCNKEGSPLDATDGSKVKLSFVAIVERPADTAGLNFWREWSVTTHKNEQDAHVVTIKALVTMGGGNSVQQNFDAQVATNVLPFLTAAGLTADDFEDPNVGYGDEDRHAHISLVTSTYVQLMEVNTRISGGTESKDVNTVFVDWDIEHVTDEQRGHDEEQVRFIRIKWGARSKIAASLTKDDIESVYLGLVLKRLQTQFGESDTPTLVGRSIVKISSTKKVVSGDWTFRLPAGSGLLTYIEVITLQLNVARFEKYTDGLDFSGDMVSPGVIATIIQDVTVTQEDAAPDLPPKPSISGFGNAVMQLESLEEIRGSGKAGREIGEGSYVTRADVDEYEARFLSTYKLVALPKNNPALQPVSGIKSDPNRAVDLFKG